VGRAPGLHPQVHAAKGGRHDVAESRARLDFRRVGDRDHAAVRDPEVERVVHRQGRAQRTRRAHAESLGHGELHVALDHDLERGPPDESLHGQTRRFRGHLLAVQEDPDVLLAPQARLQILA
jgi:hypothetical protein